MTTIGPVYPAQFVVSQAEVKLVADQAAAAGSLAIKAHEQKRRNRSCRSASG